MLTPAAILGPKGRVAARLPNYEHRPQQLVMAEAVAKAIASGRHLIVEAGTGVGKSFAYLVPAILAATDPDVPAKDRRRAVISTHTISLQEQLMQKDIPFLRSVMPLEFTAVLVKGRGNYLSLRRLKNALQRAGSLFAATTSSSSSGRSRPGPAKPTTARWRTSISARCRRSGTKWPATTATAWAGRARRTMSASTTGPAGACSNAQILVVNHALLFTDLALRRQKASILPDYDVVVFDEAHTMEAVAGEHLGLEITSGQVEYTLRQALQRADQPRPAGSSRAGRRPAAGDGMPRAGRRLLRRAWPSGWTSQPRRQRPRRAAGHGPPTR